MTLQPTVRFDALARILNVDQALADLLERMTCELEERGAVDVEAFARTHPEHAQRLRELLPAMQAVACWGRAPDGQSAAAVRLELRQRVRQMLGELSAVDREILLRRYLERLPSQEIAAIMGVSEAAVNMRHMRLLRRIRRML